MILTLLKCLLQLILSPAKGWEDISHEGTDSRELLLRGYLPFLGVVAVSCLFDAVYSLRQVSLAVAISHGVLLFVKYLVAYYIAMFIVPLKLPDYIDGDINEKRLATYIIYSQGLLATVSLLDNVLPFDMGFTHFLPIYVAIVMWKGARYMAVRQQQTGYFMLLMLGAVMAVPYVIGWVFDILF